MPQESQHQEDERHTLNTKLFCDWLAGLREKLGVLAGLSDDKEIEFLKSRRDQINNLIDLTQTTKLSNKEKIDCIADISKNIYERRRSNFANRLAIIGVFIAIANASVAWLNYSLASAIRHAGDKNIRVTIESAPGLSVKVDSPITVRDSRVLAPAGNLPGADSRRSFTSAEQ